ncbi:hypothetical protein FRC19_000209 [Serendipita sp. 401]|nr:hypothetical protein FRC19_000209 [Serendipita sp. 401]
MICYVYSWTSQPTTGTFVLATTAAQAKAFSRAFMHKESSEGHQSTVIKRYIALVYTGSPETNLDMLKDPRHNSAETSPSSKPHIPIETVAIQSKLNRMKLDLYIGAGGRVSLWRDVSATLNPVDFDREISRRKVAISEFNILGLSAQYPIALVGMRLYTGIKHQLRVTLASHLKAPILGDDLHGGSPEDSAKILPGLVPANKLMLHASSVSLQRFKSKKPFCFHICAAPPQEFLDVCQKAGIDVPPPLRNGGVWYDAENVTDSLRWETVCQTNIADDTVGVFALEGAWLS